MTRARGVTKRMRIPVSARGSGFAEREPLHFAIANLSLSQLHVVQAPPMTGAHAVQRSLGVSCLSRDVVALADHFVVKEERRSFRTELPVNV